MRLLAAVNYRLPSEQLSPVARVLLGVLPLNVVLLPRKETRQ